MSAVLDNDRKAQLAGLYEEMQPDHLFPLWEVLAKLVVPEPQSPAMPARWSYETIRRFLLRSGDLISAEEAERRVLILENPGLPGQSAITPRLYAGLQLILPGEIAPCHRHSQSALRFVMEGEGAYTAVDGEKAFMNRFDLILTPNGRWHDHGHPGNKPMIWLDGLDIPIVRYLDAGFSDRLDQPSFPESAPPASTQMHYGRNMRPVRSMAAADKAPDVPLFHYPYAQWSEALAAVSAHDAPDPWLGHALEFLNPADGGPVMATVSVGVRLIPAGFETGLRRSTEGAVYVVVEGAGQVEVDGTAIELAAGDIVVVPSWCAARWQARQQLVLFTYSDRGVLEKLKLYKEALA
ncbi:gentisate 1,2-dioxygenase [Novosphingobium sp.]|uniref:gentisate 1,2-dioxygenase n=1 Tax=Novosphingobium sp. TaxID=1874826 RepID=UPI0035B4BA15